VLQGKRIAILIEDDFEDSEVAEPMRALKNAGARLTLVGSGSKSEYQGKRGSATFKADTTADKVSFDLLDGVVIPGGHAPDRMRLHQPMIDLVKKAVDSGKVVGAICHGPQMLISADVVRGRQVTSWPSIAVDLRNAGAIWVDSPVVRDGNIVTSRRPADLPKFSRAMIEALRAPD
jgi:protease I